MQNSYWSSIFEQRTSRRRALAATGGLTAAAAFLAACGGGDGGESGGSADKSGLLTEPSNTTTAAKRGGTLKWFQENEPSHLDIHIGLAPLNRPNQMTNSNLVNEKVGVLAQQTHTEVVPDLAESWEWSSDRLQLTLKLRQGVKWHNKAPVNGRVLDTEDIVKSWDRFAAKGQGRGTLANVANPNAPILGVTSPDSRTVIFKLKEPVAYLLSQLTPYQTGNFWPVPKETDASFDNRRDMIGTGPYMLENYTPSVGMTFKRHPEYWDAKSGAYFDQIDFPFILDYSQAIAQLKAGNIWDYRDRVKQDEVLALKREAPDLQMYLFPPQPTNMFSPGNTIQFGGTATEANKHFKDERVRQAISMAIDRDAYIDVFNNVDQFVAEGLPVKGYWHTAIGAAPPWWLDPQDEKAFGPNARYYRHDVVEAKKLLAAAGFPNGVEILTSYISGTQLGPDFQRTVEVRQDMLREVGINPKTNLIDYTTEYLPRITGGGKFDGLIYRTGVASGNDATIWLDWRYKSGGGDGWFGFDKAGKGDGSGDPEVDALIAKARGEVDTEKRKAYVHDIQRLLAKAQYGISEPGKADYLQLAWPAIGNYHVFNGDRRLETFYWWGDDTKPPLKRA